MPGRLTVVRLATSELDADLTEALRELLLAAFDGDFTDDDWDHACGGDHLVALDAGTPVGHAAVVRRLLEVDGQPFPTGYLEAVATRPDRQGAGVGTALVRAADAILRDDHQLGGLATGEHGFYGRLGWERWEGTTAVRRHGSLVPTPDDDDALMVRRFGPSATIALTGQLTCDDRAGEVW